MKLEASRWPPTLFAWVFLLLAMTLATFPADAQTAEPPVAKAVSVQGTVETQRAGQTPWQPVKLNDTFQPGDAIRVLARSRADIALLDQSVLRLNANTTIKVEAPRQGKTSLVDMLRGAAHFFSRGPESLEVNTPFTVAGVRGTEFFINLESQATLLTVFEGTVVAQNAAGSLTLTDGQSAIAEAGKAPVVRVVARPRDAVHWTLYYPPVIHDKQAPTYRAQSLLAVGAVDEARSELERVRQADPRNADALSLLSIMALVQGDKEQALQLAHSAVEAGPASASALMARSYAEQARFDLPAASASVQRAVEAEPANALAWARLSELHASAGELDKSAAAAQRAVELAPELSRTQTVIGFAHLLSVRTALARSHFEKAISLDQADPLPRLGLGLAKIRDGDLGDGRREIEVAASLDPGNALVRSYLGKAYYAEKHSPRDEREFGVAKQLDPKDPTPWFYDAIAKQTTNRPLQALQDLEKARELNDNRAVYRSQLLLDSDAAARAASQARIYSELGFQQRALLEGWESVARDPASFSAHRFLADSYNVLPRHEIARVSELLQSQLLQPVGLTPIQPRLAESNLFLISAGGPGALAFNEYNQLFSGDGFSLQASALAGNRDSRGSELVASGLAGTFSFSVGGFRYETDGWRANAHQKDTIGNVFVQKDFGPGTGLQFEYRSRDIDAGDVQLYRFADSARNQFTTSAQTDTYRLGLRHALSPQSTLLVSVLRQSDERHARDTSDPTVVADIREPRNRATGAELQYLYRSARFNAVGGVGRYKLDRRQLTNFEIPGLMFTSVDDFDASVEHSNIYLYGYLNLRPNLTMTVGASADFFKSDGRTTTTTTDPFFIFGGDSVATTNASRSKDRFNPKLGLSWNPVPDTTLRAAWFRVMKRALIANQTLEPTQVAGFNQFYDDIEATRSTVYGLAADRKFSPTVFGGISATWRELDVPIPFLDPFTGASQIVDKDWKERLLRAYMVWAPHSSVALTAEFQHERFERTNDSLNFGLQEATTRRVPLGVRIFLDSGWTLGLKATHIRQDGLFQPKGGGCTPCQRGSSSFWLTDLALSYRLPQRRGFISVGVTNLSDRGFAYQETDFNNPTILPRRMAFVRLTLALP